MKLLFSFIILSSFTFFPLHSEEKTGSCVTLTGSENQPTGQTAFTFYNSCPVRMYINACVADKSGETKLYKSFKSVPAGGNFTIYTFPDMTTDDIQWIAGESDPGIPPLCLLHDR